MSQKFVKKVNKNTRSTAYGKYFAKTIYDKAFVGTKALADFIQTQASVKRSDVVAVLDELGAAMKHFFEMGQKVKLEGIGIFKVGFSSIGSARAEDCGAQNITTRRVLFAPETVRVVTGVNHRADGTIVQKFAVAKNLEKDVVFEEAKEYAGTASAAEQPEG